MRSASESPPNRPSPAAEAGPKDVTAVAPLGNAAAALAETEVAALLAPLAASPVIALAVSGGSDSLALLTAVDRWRKVGKRPRIIVLTVDHGLSPGSDAVAASVAAVAAARGLEARTLTWPGPKPKGDIEAAARQARYRLLVATAREAGASHLLTAHSMDDQAETFLMRLERGSGVFGLAAMRRDIDLDGLILFRPFLGVSRTRLAATTAAAGLSAHEDPMNVDPRFLRVRMRRLLPALAAAGIDATALAETAARLARVADAVDDAVDRLVAASVTVDAFAVATISGDSFAAAPEEVRFRLIVRLLLAIGGDDYPPRYERLQALLAALLKDPSTAMKRTLAGVVVERRPRGILLYREAGRDGLPVLPAPPGFVGLWDRRFRVEVAADIQRGLVVAALGTARPDGLVRAAGVPAGAMAALPAFFAGDRIVAVPSLRWSDPSLPQGGVGITETVTRQLARPPRFPQLAESWSNPIHSAVISA